jgi:hypothetical protein
MQFNIEVHLLHENRPMSNVKPTLAVVCVYCNNNTGLHYLTNISSNNTRMFTIGNLLISP